VELRIKLAGMPTHSAVELTVKWREDIKIQAILGLVL